MRRLAWLTLLASARAAPDTDTQLKRAAALARWVDRTGPAPESWTVTSPKDVTVGPEVHAGKIKKVSRATVDLGGSSAVVKTIEQNEGPEARRERVAEVPERTTYNVSDGRRLPSDEKQPQLPETGRLRGRGPRRARGAREVPPGHVCASFRKDTCVGRCS